MKRPNGNARSVRPGSAADVEVAVVGAGPYGLSVAAHLRAHKRSAFVLGEPMGGWISNMPKGMFLKSERDASNLSAPTPGHTLRDYCSVAGISPLTPTEPVPIGVFVDYGLWFQQQFVPDVERSRVTRITKADGAFDLDLDSGTTVRARQVVVAAGLFQHARMPAEFAALVPDGSPPDGPVSHTSQHADFSGFAGRRVAVIGRGQSALESAALLNEAGAEVHLLVRAEQIRWSTTPNTSWRLRTKPSSGLGPGWGLYVFDKHPGLVRRLPDSTRLYLVKTILGPGGSWWLRDRVDGAVNIRTGCEVEHAAIKDGSVVIRTKTPTARSEELTVDHVIAGTGYHFDLDRAQFLSESLRAQLQRVGSSPRLSDRFESSVPGLFFTGLAAAASFGPVLRFVRGTEFTARRISASSAD